MTENKAFENNADDGKKPDLPDIPVNDWDNDPVSNPSHNAVVKDTGKGEINSPQPTIWENPKTKMNGFKIFEAFISISSTVLTLIAIYVSCKSLESTNKSVKISEQALNDSRIKDSIQRRNDSLKDIKDDIAFYERIKQDSITKDIAYKSLQAQINSIQENKNQFEIENRPNIAIEAVLDDIYTSGKGSRRAYLVLKNFGRTPCFIESIKTNCFYTEDEQYNIEVKYNSTITTHDLVAPDKEIKYLIENSYQEGMVEIGRLKKGKVNMFVIAEIIYIDAFNIHKYKSTICVKCIYIGQDLVLDVFNHPYNKMTIIK